ncbi:MAG: phosphatidylglycerol lysyltransferase domain-containing protein [Treponema sp.]|nr:phosphatidylglycerol lysyltransferase domain-containing protein [Treponema sp.]
MSAALISTWSFYYNGLCRTIDDFLVIVYFCDVLPVYFTVHRPSGGEPKGNLQRLVNTLYDLSRRGGLPFLQIRCIEERFLEEFEAVEGYAVKTEYRENDNEYAYRTEDFLDLKGTVNLNKRQRLTKLFKQGNISFRPITNKEAGLCLEIEDEWCRDKDCDFCASFMGCERKALENMVDIFDERFYKGLFLCCDGIPTGYGIGEIINPRTGIVYFAKSPMQNHFLYILYMITKTFFICLEYINLDSDVGNQGIRTFKRHLGVYELWRKYICTFTKPEDQNR